MSLFLQRVFDSFANGSAYAALAVAISMVFRSTGVLNLAQGQLAMLSAYIAVVFAAGADPTVAFSGWLTPFATPWPIWAAVAGAVVVSAAVGALLEYTVIRPMGGDPVPTIGATLGLYLLIGTFVVKHFGGMTRFLGSPFPQEHSDRFVIGGARLWFDSIGLTLTMLAALGVLGVVTDYTLDYRRDHFEVTATEPTREQLHRRLVEHAASALPKAEAEATCAAILEAEDPMEQAVETLIRFTYDHLVAQRKQAVRNMAELCRDFKGSDSFRDGILDSLEWSEFAEDLAQWLRRPDEDKGNEDIKKLLDKADTADRRRQLVGAVRRVLESAPERLDLRVLSVRARARCEAVTDQSVLEEVRVLCEPPLQNNRIEPEVAALSEVAQARDEVTTGRAAATLVARRPTAAYSRAILASPAGTVPSVQAVVAAAALQRLTRLAHTLSFVENESD